MGILPCANTSHVDIAVTESKHNIDFKVADVEAGTEKDIPVPGLSVDIPEVGSAGVDVAVEVDGNLDNLRLKVGLNACTQVRGHEVCGSALTSYLPIWILHGS